MRITESQLRKIVRQEAGRLVNRNLRENLEGGDPASFVKEKMKEIEDLFVGGYDPDDAMDNASMIIDDLCFDLNEMLHSWLMDYLKDDQAARAEYDRDIMDDR